MSYDLCVTCGKQGNKPNAGVIPCDRADCERKPPAVFSDIFGANNCRQSEVAHTPWYVGGPTNSGLAVIDNGTHEGGHLAECEYHITAFIVTACNAHDELVAALAHVARGPCEDQRNGDKCICSSCTASAALAKVRP